LTGCGSDGSGGGGGGCCCCCCPPRSHTSALEIPGPRGCNRHLHPPRTHLCAQVSLHIILPRKDGRTRRTHPRLWSMTASSMPAQIPLEPEGLSTVRTGVGPHTDVDPRAASAPMQTLGRVCLIYYLAIGARAPIPKAEFTVRRPPPVP